MDNDYNDYSYDAGRNQEKTKAEEIALIEQMNKDKAEMKIYLKGMLAGGLFVLCCFVIVLILRIAIGKPLFAVDEPEKPVEQSREDSAVTADVMTKMQKIEAVIDAYFYKEETDKQLLIEDAYKGMMASLGDPYSTYYSEAELQELMEQTEGIYFGIGAYVSMDKQTGYAMINGVIEGTPAQDAELREGDIIYEVDGKLWP